MRSRLVHARYATVALVASIAAPAGVGGAVAIGLRLGAVVFGGWLAARAVRYAIGEPAALPAGTPGSAAEG